MSKDPLAFIHGPSKGMIADFPSQVGSVTYSREINEPLPGFQGALSKAKYTRRERVIRNGKASWRYFYDKPGHGPQQGAGKGGHQPHASPSISYDVGPVNMMRVWDEMQAPNAASTIGGILDMSDAHLDHPYKIGKMLSQNGFKQAGKAALGGKLAELRQFVKDTLE